MITGLWENIEVYCCDHDDKAMELVAHKGVVFYQCPQRARDYDNKVYPTCKNDLPLNFFEKFLAAIEDMMLEAERNDEQPNFQGLKLAIGRYEFNIFEHTDKIKIKVRNTRA